MSEHYKAPEVVQRIHAAAVSTLSMAIGTLEERGIEVPAELITERDEKQAHVSAVADFAGRMKFGSATSAHAEGVLDYLIEQGWTPPPGAFLLDHKSEEQA